jgi:hypothetical protein
MSPSSGVCRAADAPEIDLVGLAHVAAIDRVAPVDESGCHDQLIDAGPPGIVLEGGRELSAGVAAQHHRRTDVAGVTAGAGDVAGIVAEAVVVLAHRHDRRGPHVAHGAAPLGLQGGHDRVQKHLDRVRTLRGIGEVPHVQRTAKLVRSQIVGMRHEKVSKTIASWQRR